MTIEVRRLDASCRADFWRVHCDANDAGWCACVAWWVPTWDGWAERTAAGNRALRSELFDRGEYDGYVLYVDGTPVAWCQVGPRDRLAKLREQFQLAPDPGTWAITCFAIAPEHRGKGLAHHLLGAVLQDLATEGVRRVEAFPAMGEGQPAEDVWTGPVALFRKHGFEPAGGTADPAVWAFTLPEG